MYLHQYDYIFAIGTLFAMLDAYNNGASQSTSSLLFDYHTNMTIKQTMSPTPGLPVSPRGPSPIVRP
jgi:hypothetical protein